jgi:hypothetical protein
VRYEGGRWLYRLGILFTAVLLRMGGLAHVPPGFTHDEGVHGQTAWDIVQGARPLYIPLANGREPLFDYLTAALMSLIGPTGLALRLTAVYTSLLLLVLGYAWVRKAFNERIALLSSAIFALNFWAVMTARHGLRSITLPALFMAAVYVWWRIASPPNPSASLSNRTVTLLALGAGLFLGLAMYTYFPARVLWLVFPAAVLWWAIVARPWALRTWRPTLLMLAVAAVIAAPLAIYLWQNPTAEVRLSQLATPLQAAQAGDWQPLLANSTAALRSLGAAGAGDGAWRYNIAGQPLLPPLIAWLAFFGLLVLVWDWRKPAHGLVLGWLVLAFLPVLVTGSDLSVPRAIALQPVLFILPALALEWGLRHSEEREGGEGERKGGGEEGRGRGVAQDSALSTQHSPLPPQPSPVLTVGRLAIAFILGLMLLQTGQGYFVDWATHPEVAVQYETAVVQAIQLANTSNMPTAISATAPERYHAQPLALLAGTRTNIGWFDGRRSVLLPSGEGEAQLIWTAEAHPTAAHALFLAPWTPSGTEPLRYTAPASAVRTAWLAVGQAPSAEVVFGQTVRLLRHQTAVQDGVIELWTLWEVVGEGTGTADYRLFAQLVGADGVLAQEDRLDVPSNQWRTGDWFWQLHLVPLPTPSATEFSLIVGFYDVAEPLHRWPVTMGGRAGPDFYTLPHP